ncbi:MAG: YncE family protein [Bacteroidota bacterium]
MKLTRMFILGLICGAFPALLSAQTYYVYAAAESEDEVAIVKFDGEKAETIERIPVGYMPTEIEGPHGLTVSPDGKYWFLTMAHGFPYGKLYKFSTGDNQLLGTTELGIFPASMQISAATGLLYTVNFNLHGKMEPSTVSVVDPETMTELTKITTGAMPHGSRISADGMHHYSVAMMSGELFEIDAMNLEIKRKLVLDEVEDEEGHAHGGEEEETPYSEVKPTWVIPHPQGGKVYVAGNGVAEILEIDLERWKIVRRLPGGKGPYNLEISPNGKYMVVTYKTDAETGIWDLETGMELARVPNSRRVSHGITISPDNKYAFVTVEGIGAEPGSVDVIDLATQKRVAVAEIGKQAGGIAFWKME